MNTISTSLKTLVIFLVTVLLCGVAYAWTPPTVAPPNPVPGVTSPINTSSLAQTKIGDLTVRALTVNTGAVFGGSIKIGNEAVPVPCSSTKTGSIRYNTTINNIEICNGTEWRSLYTSVTSNSSGNGSFTCNADKCVATCASNPGVPVTLTWNQTKFCTKKGTVSRSVFGTSGGGVTGNLNASINKKSFGWVAAPVNYSVICNFFERGSMIFMLSCRDNYGTYMPWARNLYVEDPFSGCTARYRNYTTGTTHADADFTNINCTGNKNIVVSPNNTCTGPTTQIHCYEATDTSNTKYNVRDNVPLNFGTFPENWTSVDTNF